MSLADQILELVGRPGAGEVAVPPPGEGPGHWAGAPSALYSDGAFWLAYRLRRPVDLGRGYANVVARSADGVRFDVVATVTADQFGAASLERPALARTDDGGWRLYVSCSTWHSKHWWVEAIDAADAAGLPRGERTMILPGDENTAWKDVVVDASGSGAGGGRWQLWACRHPLDGGDDAADRMTSWHATSADGLRWTITGPVLGPTPGSWDARGTRVSAVLAADGQFVAFYDGRASAAENWYERTGYALGAAADRFAAAGGPTPAGHTVRYVSVAQPPGGYRVYWEAARADGANELRTAYLPA